jgi:hypothetical protein
MSGWDGRGSTRAWRRFRERILERDNHQCQLRFDGCLDTATEPHHTQPWTGRPEDVDPNTVIATCASCNKHAGWTPTNTDPEPRPWT